MNPRDREQIPDWKLERFLLGELDPDEMNRIERELKGDEALQARLKALEESNQELLERYPAPWMARQIERKLESSASHRKTAKDRRGFRLWPVPALSMAAVVILLLAVMPQSRDWLLGETDRPVPITDTRIKGLEPQLKLYRKTESGSERLQNGVAAREHDLILIQYEAAGKGYGVIFSVDGHGSITRHIPLEGDKSPELDQDGAISLDFAYELDDAPLWEKFYFVTSDSLFDVETAIGSVPDSISKVTSAGGDSLTLPPSLHQTIFTLTKETSND